MNRSSDDQIDDKIKETLSFNYKSYSSKFGSIMN